MLLYFYGWAGIDNYSPLSGQNKLAKDHVLRDLLLNPEPPDHIQISLLDDTALREAFTLEVGMLPDVSDLLEPYVTTDFD